MDALYEGRWPTNSQRTFWSLTDQLIQKYSVLMVMEADATQIHQIREEAKSQGKLAPSITAFLLKAAARTMALHPCANEAILGPPFLRRVYRFNNTNIAVAVEKSHGVPGQAMASVVKDAGQQSLAEITLELRRLRDCTPENDAVLRQLNNILRRVPWPLGKLILRLPTYLPSLWVQHRGCAAWVNAPAQAGVDLTVTSWAWPITFSCGLMKERPWIHRGELTVRRTIPLVMAFDRRIMGGGPASRTLRTFKDLLENAATELRPGE